MSPFSRCQRPIQSDMWKRIFAPVCFLEDAGIRKQRSGLL